MKEWLFRWGPAILIMGLIFTASSTAGSDLPDIGIMDFVAKKGGHLAGYALLGAASLHGLIWRRTFSRSRLFIAGILVVLYAVSDEWHQSFTPGRHPALTDIVIDSVGGILGIVCVYVFRKRLMFGKKKIADYDCKI